MRIDSDKQWTVNPLAGSISHNRLRDRENMPLIEGSVKRRSAMPRRPERDALFRNPRIRPIRKISNDQPRNVHQIRSLRGLASIRTHTHPGVLSPSKNITNKNTTKTPQEGMLCL